jgi:hypothetical protein
VWDLTAELRGSQDRATQQLHPALHPVDLDRSQRFYRDVLGLAVYGEFGSAAPRRSSGSAWRPVAISTTRLPNLGG